MLTLMEAEPTIRDVLAAVAELSTTVTGLSTDVTGIRTDLDDLVDSVQKFTQSVDARFDQVDARFDQVDARFDRLEGRVGYVESAMVTKEYLDDKLADVKGELITTIRKTDGKIDGLADALLQRGVIDDATRGALRAAGPFSSIG